MKTISEYLSEYRGITVSPPDADELARYWANLRRQRLDVDEAMLTEEEIPIVFDPASAHGKNDDQG